MSGLGTLGRIVEMEADKLLQKAKLPEPLGVEDTARLEVLARTAKALRAPVNTKKGPDAGEEPDDDLVRAAGG